MILSTEKIELFDRYLNNEMTLSEVKFFENKLLNSAELKSEFEFFKNLEQGIRQEEIIDFKQKLQEWDSTKLIPLNRTKKNHLRWIGVAATLVVLIGIASIITFQTPQNEKLVASYFEPYDNVLTVRGEKEDLDDALLKYEQKEYAQAIRQFEKYKKNREALFYLGESYLAVKAYDKAISAFTEVIKSNSIFSEIATFHLALAQIGNDEQENALSTLKKIPPTSDYHSAAISLLDELN
jgi:TolA-binding protein